MDITVCGKTYANVMGVKATDKDGNEVVFGTGDFAIANVTITNATDSEFYLGGMPQYMVADGTKIISAFDVDVNSGETVEVSVVYPVGGFSVFGTPAEVEITGNIERDTDEIAIGGDGTITITGLPK